MIENLDHRQRWVLVLTALCFFSILFAIPRVSNFVLQEAYEGIGPQDYVTVRTYPENFTRNWLTDFADHFERALPMRLYLFFDQHLGISPQQFAWPFIIIQALVLSLGVYMFAWAILGKPYNAYVVTMVTMGSALAGLDLARFCQGLGSTVGRLYYGFPYAFGLLALSFLLRRKLIASFVFLFLSCLSHLTLGLSFAIFSLCFILADTELYRKRAVWLLGVLFGATLFLSLVTFQSITLLEDEVSLNQWLNLTRIFSFHWYPRTLRQFSARAQHELFPLLFCAAMIPLLFSLVPLERRFRRGILYSLLAALFLAIAGICFSDYYPFRTLIKIAPHRETWFISFIFVLLFSGLVVEKFFTGSFLEVLVGCFAVPSMLFSKPGAPMLVMSCFLSVTAIRAPVSMKIRAYLFSLTGAIVALTAVDSIDPHSFFYESGQLQTITSSLWTPLRQFRPFDGFDFSFIGGLFRPWLSTRVIVSTWLILFTCIFVLRRIKKTAFLFPFIGLALSAFSLVGTWCEERYWRQANGPLVTSYLEVQEWARTNTDPSSLFLLDPAHAYGWRGYSQRSSFGNLREWGYGNAYAMSQAVYEEGLKRMREFGIDIETATPFDIYESVGHFGDTIFGLELEYRIRNVYYLMTTAELEQLAAKYAIQYTVMEKRYMKVPHPFFQAAFENAYHIVYRVGP